MRAITSSGSLSNFPRSAAGSRKPFAAILRTSADATNWGRAYSSLMRRIAMSQPLLAMWHSQKWRQDDDALSRLLVGSLVPAQRKATLDRVMYIRNTSVGRPMALAGPFFGYEDHVADFFRIGGVGVRRQVEDDRVSVGLS